MFHLPFHPPVDASLLLYLTIVSNVDVNTVVQIPQDPAINSFLVYVHKRNGSIRQQFNIFLRVVLLFSTPADLRTMQKVSVFLQSNSYNLRSPDYSYPAGPNITLESVFHFPVTGDVEHSFTLLMAIGISSLER